MALDVSAYGRAGFDQEPSIEIQLASTAVPGVTNSGTGLVVRRIDEVRDADPSKSTHQVWQVLRKLRR